MDDGSLIDEVFAKSGFAFISDIHYSPNHEKLKTAVQCVDVNKYSLSEWCDFISYVTGNKGTFDSIEAAYQHLISFLSKQ